MNASSNHGGARPKVRADDQRTNNGGSRPGAGPKPKSFTLKLGDKLAAFRRDAEGRNIDDGAGLWTVAEIDRSWLTITTDNGDTYRLRR